MLKLEVISKVDGKEYEFLLVSKHLFLHLEMCMGEQKVNQVQLQNGKLVMTEVKREAWIAKGVKIKLGKEESYNEACGSCCDVLTITVTCSSLPVVLQGKL